MMICERCRADEARCFPHDVALCYECAGELHVFDRGDTPQPPFVGQEGIAEGAAENLMGHANARTAPSAADAGKAIEKTADAAGQIAKTLRVVGIIVAVSGAAWVGYALWKARQQAIGLQQGAQHAILAHPELLRI